MTVNDVFEYLNSIYPVCHQMSFDNSGLLIGNRNSIVNNPMLALDITSSVIEDAISKKSSLIITHHPIIFNPIKDILDDSERGKIIRNLIIQNISVISIHTCADVENDGVNDVLIAMLGCNESIPLEQLENGCSLGRIGFLETECSFFEFLERCKKNLNVNGLKYYYAGRSVKKIACVGGAGSSSIYSAQRFGCDTFISSEFKHHEILSAKELGINIVDAGHFATENPFITHLKDKLEKQFLTEFIVADSNTQLFEYYI